MTGIPPVPDQQQPDVSQEDTKGLEQQSLGAPVGPPPAALPTAQPGAPDTGAVADETSVVHGGTPQKGVLSEALDVAKYAAKNIGETVAGLPANIAAGTLEGISNASNAVAAGAKGLVALTEQGHLEKIRQTDPELAKQIETFQAQPAADINPLQVKQNTIDKYMGKPGNIVDSLVRGLANFGTLDALTAGLGPEIEGTGVVAKAARYAISTAKPATLMTIGADPHAKDFVTQLAQKTPGAAGRFATAVLGAKPYDPDWVAYTKAEGRNLLTAATMNGLMRVGGALMAAHVGNPEVLKPLLADTVKPDAADITKNPDGTATVKGEGGSVQMPSEGAAEVEVAQQNISKANQDLLVAGPAKYDQGWREIAKALSSKKGNAAQVAAIVRDHDMQVPFGGPPGHIQNYITDLGKLVKMSKGDAEDLATGRAAKILDPDASFPELHRRFAQWFGTTEDLPAKIRGAHLYLQVLGRQATGVAEALEMAPESPEAAANVDKVWTSMMQLYAPLKGAESMAGSTLREAGVTSPAEAGLVAKESVQKAAAAEAAPEAGLATSFGEGAPAKPPSGPQATEQLAAGQGQEPLTPEARDQFAMSLRIADGDPSEMLEATRQALIRRELAGQGMTPETARAAAKAATMSAAQKAANTFATYEINNMVSGVPTLEKLPILQAIMMAHLPIEMMGGGIIRVLKGATHLDGDEMRAGSALFQQGVDVDAGFTLYWRDGIRAAARLFRGQSQGIDPRHPMFPNGMIDPKFYDLGDHNYLYVPMQGPTRLHASVAEFTKTVIAKSVARSQALRDAREQNLSPAQTADAVIRHVTNAFDPAGRGINAEALLEGQRATMTQPMDNVLLGRDISSLLQDHPILRLKIMPFQSIGTNLFRENWKMFPGLARFQLAVKQAYAEGGDAKARAQANQVIGASLLALGIHLASQHIINGRGPSDPQLQKGRRDNGIDPYTVKFGDFKMSLDRMEAGGPLIELGASAEEGIEDLAARQRFRDSVSKAAGENKNIYWKGHPVCQSLRQIADFCDATRGTLSDDGGHAAVALLGSLAQKAQSNEWLVSMSSFLDMLTNPGSPDGIAKLQRWVTNEAATVVPWSSFWSSINQDPIHRETRGIIESLRAKAQGFSSSLEPHRNSFGQPVELPPGFTDWLPGNHINPFITGNWKTNNATQDTLIALGRALPEHPKVTKGIGGGSDVDWTARSWDQANTGGQGQSPYDRAMELLSHPIFGGKTAEQVFTAYVNSPEFQKLPAAAPLETEGPRVDSLSMLQKAVHQVADSLMLKEPRYSNFAKHVRAATGAAIINRKLGLDKGLDAYRILMRLPGEPQQ